MFANIKIKVPFLNRDADICAKYLSDQQLRFVPNHLTSLLSTYLLMLIWCLDGDTSLRVIHGVETDIPNSNGWVYSGNTYKKLLEIHSRFERLYGFKIPKPVHLSGNNTILRVLRGSRSFREQVIDLLLYCSAEINFRFQRESKLKEFVAKILPLIQDFQCSIDTNPRLGLIWPTPLRLTDSRDINAVLATFKFQLIPTPLTTHLSGLPISLGARNYRDDFMIHQETEFHLVEDWIPYSSLGGKFLDPQGGNFLTLSRKQVPEEGFTDATTVDLWRYEQCTRGLLGYSWTKRAVPLYVTEFSRFLNASFEQEKETVTLKGSDSLVNYLKTKQSLLRSLNNEIPPIESWEYQNARVLPTTIFEIN